MSLDGIGPAGLYTRLGQPWWLGVGVLLAAGLVGFFLVPDALLLLVGLGVPLGGGLLFGYRGRSFWWAVVAAVAAWLVYAVVRMISEGWDVGPVEDVVATVLFGLYLAGVTILGGLLGKRVATPTSRADRPRGTA